MISLSFVSRPSAWVVSLGFLSPVAVSAADYLWVENGGTDSNGFYSYSDEDNWDEPVVDATFPTSADQAVFANIYRDASFQIRRRAVGPIKLGANRTLKHAEFSFGATANDYSMELGDSSAAHTLTLTGKDTDEIIRFDVFNYHGGHSMSLYCPLAWSPTTGIVQFENDRGTLALHGSISGECQGSCPLV